MPELARGVLKAPPEGGELMAQQETRHVAGGVWRRGPDRKDGDLERLVAKVAAFVGDAAASRGERGES